MPSVEAVTQPRAVMGWSIEEVAAHLGEFGADHAGGPVRFGASAIVGGHRPSMPAAAAHREPAAAPTANRSGSTPR